MPLPQKENSRLPLPQGHGHPGLQSLKASLQLAVWTLELPQEVGLGVWEAALQSETGPQVGLAV